MPAGGTSQTPRMDVVVGDVMQLMRRPVADVVVCLQVVRSVEEVGEADTCREAEGLPISKGRP